MDGGGDAVRQVTVTVDEGARRERRPVRDGVSVLKHTKEEPIMAVKDYAHWNEDALYMWWQEEGRHVEEPPDPDDYQMSAAEMDAEDAYNEGEYDAENGEPLNPAKYAKADLQRVYKEGYNDAKAALD